MRSRKVPRSRLAKPPCAVSVNVGSHAVRATPISSDAASTRRAAAYTSGRRASSADGRPGGTSGTRTTDAVGATAKAVGDTPVSTASASTRFSRSRRLSARSARAVSRSADARNASRSLAAPARTRAAITSSAVRRSSIARSSVARSRSTKWSVR
ncbi:hypothetical protein WT83_19025 [Burkholderia territorii]|uniref:Uncharacterized protein n=1 Tax=Burkholderia territorii TaxID=1503055 RepID=A0A108ELI9_9BURK|nr:hypothetical protein WT83_19025 [Burkholderia territorii]